MLTFSRYTKYLLFVLASLPALVIAQQDVALTRSVALQNDAAGKQLTINQVDTSQFPNVNIFATVLNAGEPVTGLTDADFRVREDEVDQEPLKVVPRLSPLSVVVTIDTSGSMSKAIGQTKEAAKSFLDSLDAGDSVMTVGFARGVNPLSNFSTDKSSGKTAIDSVVARGDTALYDALYTSVESLKGRPGRKAVALLSDGVDDDGSGKQLSKHSVDEVLALAKEVNVPIFTIGLGTGIDKTLLERVAKETGARYFSAPTVEELKVLYASLGKQLTGQYNILYTSNLPGDGSTHRVQLAHAGLNDMKEYLSPNTGSAAPVVVKAPPVEAAPPVVAAAGGALEIEGGTDFDSAVSLNPDQSYKLKAAAKGRGHFFKVQLAQGTRFHSYAQLMGNGQLSQNLFNSLRNKIEPTDWCSSKWCTTSIGYSVDKDSNGQFYMVLESPKGDEVNFGYFALPQPDAGQSGDAGGNEAGAVSIQENTPYSGFISQRGDKSDFYKIKLPQGSKLIRGRPAGSCAISMYLYDDNGSRKGDAHSSNAGAGFSEDMELKGPATLYIQFSTNESSRCPYNFIVGGPEVEAPAQPANPDVAVPNIRTGL